MTKILQIHSSIFSNQGQSSQLANQFVAAWQENHADTQVVLRDLSQQTIAHLDATQITAFSTQAEERTPEQQKIVSLSDTLINEIQQADMIVIGLPMYNFGIPSTLKAYFDQIARAGITFRYTEHGPLGLITGKQVFIFAARGGLYAGSALDSESNYVRDFLSFLGLTDIEFIYAEGLNMGDELKNNALTAAKTQIEKLAL